MTSYLANLAPSDGSRAGGGGAISPPRGPARGIHTHTILTSGPPAPPRWPALSLPDTLLRTPPLGGCQLLMPRMFAAPHASRRRCSPWPSCPACPPPRAARRRRPLRRPPPLRHDANGLRARELLEVCAEQLGFLDGAAARRARPLAARHLARRGRGVVQNGARAVGPGRRGRRRGGGGGRRRTASSGGMRQWRCQARGQSSQRSSSPAPPQSAHASSSQSGQSQSPPTSSGGGAGSRQPTWKRLPHEG